MKKYVLVIVFGLFIFGNQNSGQAVMNSYPSAGLCTASSPENCGQCTEYVAKKWTAYMRKNEVPSIGNAFFSPLNGNKSWYDQNESPPNLNPAANAVVVLTCQEGMGACAPSQRGHVAWVESVSFQRDGFVLNLSNSNAFGDLKYSTGSMKVIKNADGTYGGMYTDSSGRRMPYTVRGFVHPRGENQNGNVVSAGSSSPWDFEYVDQSTAKVVIPKNGIANLSLTLRNKGANTWTPQSVRLGTCHPNDRASQFFMTKGGNWLSNNRITMLSPMAAPGGLASFQFKIQAPPWMVPGVYKEYFCPVVEGVQWMKDIGIYWEIQVK